jgi:hypothetical protein
MLISQTTTVIIAVLLIGEVALLHALKVPKELAGLALGATIFLLLFPLHIL